MFFIHQNGRVLHREPHCHGPGICPAFWEFSLKPNLQYAKELAAPAVFCKQGHLRSQLCRLLGTTGILW